MNAIRRRKLIGVLSVVLVLMLVSFLVLYALRQNLSLFYSPTQISEGQAPYHHAIRVGGMVVKDSVKRTGEGLFVQFQITDFKHTLSIEYKGILPDLFREGQGIVAQGILEKAGHFKALEVLAKHDENYMPPEVRDSLAKQ
ncbi:cytochrome c maturation protein CcmE [Legionella impletisoli]|uniref:Cytochrome c-type biogenesis protein CcmE n=1 Tax=Legionella impletisoli TaxID=343510 RepID=A0A917N9E1_9GAMM|nr:cytochrome c maturation protein CcmE [Legionella impletisoli]GGI78739.1 cytochrome c-type biogenesis protein CcmE [Legionella impletisoli]